MSGHIIYLDSMDRVMCRHMIETNTLRSGVFRRTPAGLYRLLSPPARSHQCRQLVRRQLLESECHF